MMAYKKALLVTVFGMSLASCTMIPDYLRPDFSAANQWDNLPGYITPSGEVAAQKLAWDEYFVSDEVKTLIRTALNHNKDLALAALNIEEARATYGVQRSNLMPTVNANGGATYQGTPEDTSTTGREETSDVYSANLGISSYELDLFGRVRSLSRAALNDFMATKAAQETVRNALIAETANAYLTYLADLELLKLTEKTLKAQQETYNILSKSLSVGTVTQLDVSRAATSVETAQVNLHMYRRLVQQDKNALFLLLGVPQNSIEIPETTLQQIAFRNSVSAGTPSEVLLARPDIRQAEYELKAANANIGAARAAFFPRIALTGAYGYASDDLSNLFSGGASPAWSFAPQITLPIFTGWLNRSNLELAEVRKKQQVVQYEKSIQTAFREVSDELVARETLDGQYKAQERLVEATQRVYNISYERYKSGIDSFLSALDAQRELYAAEQSMINVKLEKLTNLVNLYRVLGGGTQDITE